MPDMLEETKALMWNRPKPITLDKINKSTGIGITWLTKFNTGKMTNPSYITIKKLNDFLKGNDDKQPTE